MQKYSGQQWCRDISESGPTVARQWPDSARQGPTPRQSGLKDTGPAVRHVRHPRHLRHARHSDTRHSDTLRHDTRISTVQPPSDTGQTQARHLRHRRHQCQSTPLRHRSDTTPTPPTPPTLRHIRAQLLISPRRSETFVSRPVQKIYPRRSLVGEPVPRRRARAVLVQVRQLMIFGGKFFAQGVTQKFRCVGVISEVEP